MIVTAASPTPGQIRNTKTEIRNEFQIQMFNRENRMVSVIGNLDLFRISYFVLRASADCDLPRFTDLTAAPKSRRR
jgi:hypothetical protein